MGKCTRKAKTTDEVSQSFLGGVRTRAKTLALKRLHEKNDFLELRSRRLEKPHVLLLKKKESKKNEIKQVSIEASFGENNLDDRGSYKSTRESTPVSLIRTADSITAPGSSTKPRIPNTPSQMNIHIPTSQDLEEFFTHVEQSQQQLFSEKYNFDVVNEAPLPGRYEWVKVMP